MALHLSGGRERDRTRVTRKRVGRQSEAPESGLFVCRAPYAGLNRIRFQESFSIPVSPEMPLAAALKLAGQWAGASILLGAYAWDDELCSRRLRQIRYLFDRHSAAQPPEKTP